MVAAASRLLRLFTGSADPETDDEAVPAAAEARRTPIELANARLMADIADFIVSCRLNVSAHNLLTALAAFSGEDPHLARAIGRLRLAGEPVTQAWIDAHTRGPDNPESEVRTLIGQMEATLDRFAATTASARDRTADCNAQLAKAVDRADAAPDTIDARALLVGARAILEQTRRLEAEIRASEKETRCLRERLARAQRDAEIDHLTGLPNRRAFETVYEREFHTAQSEIDHLCVAFCDIDHFKQVNDNHGHDTGDRVIKAVAETLGRLSNAKCHVARHGGEEFVLLFRGLTKAEAREKLDAARENFATRRLVNRKTDDPIGRVTFSGGVADVFAYPTPRDALRAADEALYLAKEQGRNAVMAAP